MRHMRVRAQITNATRALIRSDIHATRAQPITVNSAMSIIILFGLFVFANRMRTRKHAIRHYIKKAK